MWGANPVNGTPFCDDKKCTLNFIQNNFYYGHIYIFKKKNVLALSFLLLLLFFGGGGLFFCFCFCFLFFVCFWFCLLSFDFERHFLRWLKQSIRVQNHKRRKINFLFKL